jgi:hypothetical protein
MTSSQCEPGLECLFPLGAGCDAQGACGVSSNDCSGSAAGLVLCGCGDVPLDLTCVSSVAALTQRTATGAACATEGGADARGPMSD